MSGVLTADVRVMLHTSFNMENKISQYLLNQHIPPWTQQPKDFYIYILQKYKLGE